MSEEQKELTWPDLVHQAMPQFQRINRDVNMVSWEAESQFAIQAIQKNSGLAKCPPYTVQNAVINIAAVGLTLNPADGYAYLIPEYNKDSGKTECQLRISFKGLIKAATDSGAIKWVKAEIVKEDDTFNYKGPCELPEHIMDPFKPRGVSVGVYCIAKTCEDDILVDLMPWEEVLKIRAAAKTMKVWDAWPDEMAKKAIIKRAAKQWPKTKKSSQLHKAVEVINDLEGSSFDPLKELEATAEYIIEAIGRDDSLAVHEAWVELDEGEQSLLWTAVTKGGFFSQEQKTYIRASRHLTIENQAGEK